MCNAFGERIVSFQTVGGNGALGLAAELFAAARPAAKIWIGNPTWPNHFAVFQKARIETDTYPYCDRSAQEINLPIMLETASRLQKGDGFLIHGCCHNPTGLDLAPDDSNRLLQVLEHRGAFTIVDCACAGFSEGFDEDLFVAREIFRTFEEAIICFFLKNFSLYRERTGFILVKCAEARTAANVTLALANIERSSYSMPPYHGAAIVSTILEDDILSRMW